MPDAPTSEELIRRARTWDQDLRQQVRRRLAPDQRQRLELRNQRHDWAPTAAQVGGVVESLREKLARGIDRVVAELGLDNEP
jgi:hypothetical protein